MEGKQLGYLQISAAEVGPGSTAGPGEGVDTSLLEKTGEAGAAVASVVLAGLAVATGLLAGRSAEAPVEPVDHPDQP